MMRECEVWMHYNKRWRRLVDLIFHGHFHHVCVIERQFMREHEAPLHRCKCGKKWAPLSTDND
jgi:hypothetical protein